MTAFGKALFTNINTAPTTYGPVNAAVAPISPDAHYDTVVIGAGLAGLHSAIELAERGQKVLILEARKIGDGASARNGGQLWPGFDSTLSGMQEEHGDNLANSAWQYVHEGIAKVHERLSAHPTKCDFKPGVALLAMSEEDDEWCKDEAKVFEESGFTFAKYVNSQTIKDKLFNSTAFTGGLLYQGDNPDAQYGHVNPALYVETLVKAARNLGVTIMEEAPVGKIQSQPEGGYALGTGTGTVRASHVVMATGADMLRPEGVGHDLLPRSFIRAQTLILATEPMSRALAAEIAPGAACGCDTREVGMNYFRMVEENDGTGRVRMTFGGADALMQFGATLAYEAGKVERDMYKIFPQLKDNNIKVESLWGGNCDLSSSALPRATEISPNFFAISGFSGQGNVLTQVMGQAVAERITEGASDRFDTLAALTANEETYPRSELLATLQVGYEMYGKPKVEAVKGWFKPKGPEAA